MKRGQLKIPSAERIANEQQALEMRRAGVTYDLIGKRLNMTARAAYALVQSGIKRTLREPSAEILELELNRLERLEFAVWPAAMQGNPQAVDRVLRIAERRAKLLGLDAPVRARVEVTDSMTAEIERLGSALGLDEAPQTTPVASQQLPSLPLPNVDSEAEAEADSEREEG